MSQASDCQWAVDGWGEDELGQRVGQQSRRNGV